MTSRYSSKNNNNSNNGNKNTNNIAMINYDSFFCIKSLPTTAKRHHSILMYLMLK